MNSIEKYQVQGLQVVTIDRGAWSEKYITGLFSSSDILTRPQIDALKDIIGSESAAHIRLFGGAENLADTLLQELGKQEVVIDRFEQPLQGLAPWLCLQAFIIQTNDQSSLRTVHFEEQGRGWVIQAKQDKMAYLPKVASRLPSVLEAYQATFEQTLVMIKKMGLDEKDLTRTWCYFRDILPEYAAFNNIRKDVFSKYGLLNKVLPASTGIQGILDTGEHLTMSALAFAGPQVKLTRVANPAQCEAPAYGSLFSRAMMVEGLGPKQLIISGLAALGLEGETLYKGDPEAQVDNTLENALSLLEAVGLGWSDVVSGIAYTKPEHYEVIAEKLQSSLLKDLPLSYAYGDVCRDDMLFEVEIMAFGE